MPCGCCGNGFCFGHLMYMLEKIAAFCAMSAIISCIIVTVIVSIGLGVGIGYNYCFVDTKTTRLTAMQNVKNSDNPPKLPKKPFVFPRSDDSSNETEVTTENANTLIKHPTPSFPSVPNIPKIPSLPPRFPDASHYPGDHPTISGIDEDSEPDSGIPKLPTTDVPGTITYIASPQAGQGFIPSGSDYAPNIASDQTSISSFPGGGSIPDVQSTPEGHGSVPSDSQPPYIPNISNFTKLDLSDGQKTPLNSNEPNIYSDSQDIPQSPNFPGSFRRIPTYSKVKLAPSLKRPAGRTNIRRLKVGSVKDTRRKQFEEIRKGVKANAKHIEKSFGASYYEDADITEEEEYDQTISREKYKRRKPVQEKKHNKVKKTTKFMPTIVIPLKKYANISPLISKILAQNKNITLQFITL